MRQLLFLLVLSVHCLACFAIDAPKDQWKKASSFYQQKQYDSAAYYYEQLTALQPQDAEVYYNLGNAYYRLNQVGPAVLNYERALHLRPSYKEAEDNLALTQGRITNRISPIPDIFFVNWWHSITAASLAGTWAGISLFLFLLVLGLLIAGRFNKIRNIPVQLYIAISIIWLFALSFAFAAAANKADSCKAVVMSMDAAMFAAPKHSKPQNIVPEGTTVELLNENNGWVEIKLPDGRAGWMERELLAKI